MERERPRLRYARACLAEAPRGWCPARPSNPSGAGGTRLRWVRFPHASTDRRVTRGHAAVNPSGEAEPMKKLIVLAVAVLAVWLGINYARTGKLAFFPSAASPAE